MQQRIDVMFGVSPKKLFLFPNKDAIEVTFAGHFATRNLDDAARAIVLAASQNFAGQNMDVKNIDNNAELYVRIALDQTKPDGALVRALSKTVAQVVRAVSQRSSSENITHF